MQDREIPHGFSFLDREYQTPIGSHFLPYESSDTFLYAFIVGATNTVIVSIVGVILATALGIVIGVARLSGNWVVSKIALVYIEFFRNVPLLVQLFFWFYIVLALPPVRQGYVIADRVYINNGGLSIPFPVPSNWGADTHLVRTCGRCGGSRIPREQVHDPSRGALTGCGFVSHYSRAGALP